MFNPQHRRLISTLGALLTGALWCGANLHSADIVTERCMRYYGCSPECRLAPRSWVTMKREHIVLQKHDYSCGAGALATLLTYYWNDPTGEEDILLDLENYLTPQQIQDRIKNGFSITDLKNIAIQRGYRAAIGTLDGVHKLYEVKVPVIVAISPEGYNHFVVVRGVVGCEIYLADPVRGNIRMNVNDFAQIWIKNSVLVVLDKTKNISTCSRLTIPMREIDPQYPNRPYVRRMINPFLP